MRLLRSWAATRPQHESPELPLDLRHGGRVSPDLHIDALEQGELILNNLSKLPSFLPVRGEA